MYIVIVMSSAIDQRKNEKLKEENGKEKKSNWLAFGISVLQNFILTLLIGILGANFIFLSSSTTTFLETIIPKNRESYFKEKDMNNPYTADNRDASPPAATDTRNNGGGEYYIGSKQNNCNKGDKRSSTIGINIFDFKKSGTWPYNLRDPNVGPINYIQKFLNWILETMYGAYSINRDFLQSWLSIFSKKNSGFISNDAFIMFIIAPLTLIASPIALVFGFFSSLFSSFFIGYTKDKGDIPGYGWIWALIGIFFGYTWVLTSSISIFQFIQYIVFFTILPLLKNFNKIKNILHCNVTTLGLLFGALVCGSALSLLDNTTSIVMAVVYILLAIKTLW